MLRLLIACSVLGFATGVAVSADKLLAEPSMQQQLDYVLQLAISRQVEMISSDGSTSKLKFALFVFKDGMVYITRVSETGRIQRCLISTNRLGAGIHKRFGGTKRLVSEEMIDHYESILEDLPPETRPTSLDRLLIVRYPSSDRLQTRHYDRTRLPKSLREFVKLAVRDRLAAKFRERLPAQYKDD